MLEGGRGGAIFTLPREEGSQGVACRGYVNAGHPQPLHTRNLSAPLRPSQSLREPAALSAYATPSRLRVNLFPADPVQGCKALWFHAKARRREGMWGYM